MSENYFSREFVVSLVLSCLLIFISLFIGVGEGSKVSLDTASQMYDGLKEKVASATVFSIFLNNFVLSVCCLIPIIGVVWMLFIQFNTGFMFGCLSVYYSVNPYLLVSMTLTSPIGLVEYLAYIFVLGESIVLVYSAIKRQFKERLFKHTPKTLILITILLFIGAYIEYLMIV